MLFVALYLVLCAAVAYFGRARRFGFLGAFLLSFVLTPLLMFIILVATEPARGRTL